MAKIKEVKAANVEFNDTVAAQEFNQLRTLNQVGDQFYVPKSDLLVIMGTKVPVYKRGTEEMELDEAGVPKYRSLGQFFYGVRVIDGKPFEVTPMYVGQIVKSDFDGRIAFPGALSQALRAGSDAFKNAICGKILTINSEKAIADRTWNPDARTWLRDEDGKLVKRENTAYEYVAAATPRNFDVARAEAMLVEFYQTDEVCKEQLEIE